MYKIIGADKNEYGPISAEQLRQWIKEGRANGQTQVLLEGTTEWKPLASFSEFADALNTPAPFATGGTPPAPTSAPGGQPSVPNYLVQSILCTLCCCLPLGIVAIIYASQVSTKLALGDYAGAQAASKNAKLWCWIAFGLGFAINAIFLVVMAIGAAAGHQ